MITRKNIIYKAVIWIYFISETLQLEILGGNFRYYFVITILLTAGMFITRTIKRCTSSKTFICEILWAFTFLLSSLLSISMRGAFINSFSFLLYLSTTFSVLYILLRRKLTIDELQDTLCMLFLFIVTAGLIQLLIFKTTGLQLATNDFAKSQLIGWQIPGFSKEANGHGKTVGFALIYCLPVMFRSKDKKRKKRYQLLFSLSLFTMVISLTRSAAYSAIFVSIYALYYYVRMNRTRKYLFSVVIKIVVILVAAISLIEFNVIKIDGVSSMKIDSFFNLSEEAIRDDSSGAFRLEGYDATIALWLYSIKTIFFGLGPGQAYGDIRGVLTRVSGLDTLGMLASVGIVGLVMFISVFTVAYRSIKRCINIGYHVEFAEQMLLELIFCYCINFMGSILYFPHLWIVLAGLIYLEISSKYFAQQLQLSAR